MNRVSVPSIAHRPVHDRFPSRFRWWKLSRSRHNTPPLAIWCVCLQMISWWHTLINALCSKGIPCWDNDIVTTVPKVILYRITVAWGCFTLFGHWGFDIFYLWFYEMHSILILFEYLYLCYSSFKLLFGSFVVFNGLFYYFLLHIDRFGRPYCYVHLHWKNTGLMFKSA